MAVQAQFPSNHPFILFPHFRPRARDDHVLVDEIHMIRDRGLLRTHAPAQFDAGAEENELVMPPQNGPVPIQAGVMAPAIEVGGGGGGCASTSGRPAGEDLVSHLHRQSAKIDAFVRLQTIPGMESIADSSSLRGLPQMVIESINKCDVDIRRELFSSILLAGGTSSMQQLKERLEKDLMEVKTRTAVQNSYSFGSHVMQYGDLDLNTEHLFFFIGSNPANDNKAFAIDNSLPSF